MAYMVMMAYGMTLVVSSMQSAPEYTPRAVPAKYGMLMIDYIYPTGFK